MNRNEPNEPAVLPGHWQLLKARIMQFAPMPEDETDLLLPLLTTVRLPKDGRFAQEGKRSDEVGFLLEGDMRHYYTRDGEEKTTYFYFEQHFVSSYFSCITGAPSMLTIEALSPCTLLVFRYAGLQHLYTRSHAWERFGRLVAEYLAAGLEDRMTGLLMLTPEERYGQLLRGGKDKIMERIPQHYIASYLGITPVSLSRIRNRILRRR